MSGGARTLDHRSHSPALYQLSYTHREVELKLFPIIETGSGTVNRAGGCDEPFLLQTTSPFDRPPAGR